MVFLGVERGIEVLLGVEKDGLLWQMPRAALIYPLLVGEAVEDFLEAALAMPLVFLTQRLLRGLTRDQGLIHTYKTYVTKGEIMEAQMRQFEQLQQILGTNDLPVGLLRLVEMGNGFRKPIYGGGYMNGADLLNLCVMWKALDKKSDTVSSLMEFKNHTPSVKMEDEPKRTVRKKKMAING